MNTVSPTPLNASSPAGGLDVDFLAGQQQHQYQQQHQQVMEGTDSSFADLLAAFTSNNNAMSPDAMLLKSPEPSAALLEDLQQSLLNANNGGANNGAMGLGGLKGLDSLGATFASMLDGGGTGGGYDVAGGGHDMLPSQQGGSPANSGSVTNQGTGVQLAQAFGSMDSSAQSQLLAALLLRHQQSSAASPSGSAPSPQPYSPMSAAGQFQSAQSRPSQHNSPLDFQQQHYGNASSPASTSHQQQQHHHHQQPPPPQQQPPPQQTVPTFPYSLPPSLVNSPLHSPYLASQQPFFQNAGSSYALPQQQHQQQQPTLVQQAQHHQAAQQQFENLQAQQQAVQQALLFQNAFSPRPFAPQQQQQQQQLQQSQVQMAMDMMGQQQHQQQQQQQAMYQGSSAGDGGVIRAPQDSASWRVRGASATGGSYASTAEGEDWGDNDFMFSPLMSPAMTGSSVYTPGSSLPPSVSYLPSNGNIVAPADLFVGLGSPAILPQGYQTDGQWTPGHHSHSNSLQGLVDQTQALAVMSPLVGPTGPGSSADLGQGTATGSGRRGAGSSSRKARPSPLLKPTPDSQLRKKKGEKRSSSVSSVGGRSATTSPFMSATQIGPLTATSGVNGRARASTSSGSQKPSPEDGGASSGSAAGFNTPSPVDLDVKQTADEGEALGPMNPPPPPSMSRRNSQQAIGNEWIQPVTPASLMNFANEVTVGGLSMNGILSGAESDSSQRSNPKPRKKRPAPPTSSDMTPNASTSNAVASSSTAPVQSTPTLAAKPPSLAPATPAPSAVAKGKARAGSITNGNSGAAGAIPAAAASARKVQTKPIAKAPAASSSGPKIKPLLANGLPHDALARLSTKSNYQNIMDGRGVDLLGLDPSTVSALNATQGAGADVRRTSHKAAEQKRRDSLKLCFEELRKILPPIAPSTIDEEKRPGEGNVGGQRSGSIDPDNPNRGVSKAALLRRSNEYIGMLHDRIDRRDYAITALRAKLRDLSILLGQSEVDEEIEGLELDFIDKDEKAAGNMAFYEAFDSEDEGDVKPKAPPRKPAASRRKSATADGEFKAKSGLSANGSRRSSRTSLASSRGAGGGNDDDEYGAGTEDDNTTAMEVEDGD